MSAGDLAAVVVSVGALAAVGALAVALAGLLRSLRQLRQAVDELRAEALPLIDEMRGTVRDAGAEVERVEGLLDAAETISATVEGASRLSYLAFRAPLIRVTAFAKGVARFLRRLTGRGPSAPPGARGGGGAGRARGRPGPGGVIPKRAFWFAAGAATGFTGAVYAYARVREARGRFAADRLAGTVSDAVVGTARSVRRTVGDALAEGRDAAREAEERMRADLAVGRAGSGPPGGH